MLIENKVNKMLIKIIFICFWNLVLKLGLMHKKYLLKLLKFYIWIINDYDSNNNDKVIIGIMNLMKKKMIMIIMILRDYKKCLKIEMNLN